MQLRLDAGGDVAALVRAAKAESLVVIVSSDLGPLATAIASAAIAPLAIERAPCTRVNAVLPAAEADPAAVDAAIQFLEVAVSTTGQVLAIV